VDPFDQAVLGILQQLQGNQQAAAQQATLDSTLQAVNAALVLLRQIVADLVDPTTGLAAIQAELATFQATTALDFTAVLTAIGTPQQTGSPVTLPATTPAGGGWVDDSNVGGLVWGFSLDPEFKTAITLLGEAHDVVYANDNAGGWIDQYSPYFSVSFYSQMNGNFPFANQTPQPLAANILSTDTLVSWLTRELPTWTVDPAFNGGDSIAVYDFSSLPLIFNCILNEAQFEALKAAFNPVPSVAAPVWPGLSNVVLGTPVAISTVVTIVEPMDGCLVAITGVPLKQGQFAFGGTVSWRNIGALAFTSDDGDEEFPQTLGFENAVYCPKAMAQAAGLVLRASAGVTGTITPWTIA
jgi:hypothetical protein